MTAAKLEYVSIGCNPVPQAVCWGCNNLIAFAGCNSIFIYKPQISEGSGRITHILNGHTARVNCVEWLQFFNYDISKDTVTDWEVVSGSTDKNVIVWNFLNEQWQRQTTLTGHKDAVTALSTLKYSSHNGDIKSLIVSSSADSSLKVWLRSNSKEFGLIQDIPFNGFIHSVALAQFSSTSDIIMACGCDNTKVELYAMNTTDNKFRNVMSLSGHEDWIRCVKFASLKEDGLLLASSSQDTYIRLWKLSIQDNTKASNVVKNDLTELELEQESFTCENNKKVVVVLESLLIGHEGWVLGLSWSKSHDNEVPVLLSASMDRTMIVWKFDDENSVWIDKARMGNVGGNALGYFGCSFSPNGCAVIGHDYQCAFHLWKTDMDNKETWSSTATVSGHYGAVEDFDWDPCGGEFALTLSTDQTTRLFAPWRRDDNVVSWHEIARPQIHGHDLKCIAMLGRFKFASGGQEKVVRIFSAPKSFYESFTKISKVEHNENIAESLPVGATVPVLGLSNKAVFEDDIKSWDSETANTSQPMKASAFASEDPPPFNPTLITEPPVEDILFSSTLWPELQKLYGHGYEIFCMAASPDARLLATACKATKQEYAGIIIWDAHTYKQLDLLISHSLTVTQLAFSHNGKYILSVSRDRTWSLFVESEKTGKFSLLTKTDKKTSVHSRIIWSCSWFPCDEYFITGSRDKKIIVWGTGNDLTSWSTKGDPYDVGEPTTAVCVSKKKISSERYVISVGLESGGIHLYSWCNAAASFSFQLIHRVDHTLSPALTVKRLRWRDTNNETNHSKWQLGICSSDHTFRILSFNNEMFS